MMNRRAFLHTCLAVSGASLTAQPLITGHAASVPPAIIMTVNGPILPEELGTVLTHEHVLVDFAPASEIVPGRYDADEVFEVALPYLQEIKDLGCQSLIEFTPSYLGRDPALLQRLSGASGLHILTNTGYYGARNDQHLPPYVFTEPADDLAARWIRDWDQGIGETGIKPGFMKIGVDSGSLSEVDQKLIRAAARAHLKTGLTMAVHTGPAIPAFEQLEILAEEGVSPTAWIWTHSQNERDLSRHVAAAERGAWVAFDGVRPPAMGRHVKLVVNMKQHGVLDHVLLSQDAGWYSVGEPGGGDFRPYSFFFTSFLPALKKAGLTDAEITQLTVTNPARAFTVQVRTA